MKLEEIQEAWTADAQIDRTELGNESLRIPELHNKYYKMYITERNMMRQIERGYKELLRAKHEFYLGSISEEELKVRGWQANPLRILRSDLPIFIDADKELTDLKMKLFFQTEKVNFLESIIKSFVNRGYLVKNAIDWIRFQNGA